MSLIATIGAGRNAEIDLSGTSTIQTSVSVTALAGISTIVGLGTIGLTLTGSAGNDTIVSAPGGGSLLGSDGNDALIGGVGIEFFDGGPGYDYARYDFSAGPVTARLDGGPGAGDAAGDVFVAVEGLVGSAFGDGLVGDGLNNAIFGQGGDDSLWGFAGSDALYAADGNDHLVGGLGADLLDGGAGYDYARYDFAAGPVTARLDGGAGAGEAAGDTYSSAEGRLARGDLGR